MNPAVWRLSVRLPGSVLMALLLVVLSAFGGWPCSMLAFAALPPPSAIHDCCPDPALPDAPATSPSPCHDVCLQAGGHQDAADRHESLTGNPDWPAPPFVAAGLLPPDWLNGSQSPRSLTAETTGPPPDQRSRVLRL